MDKQKPLVDTMKIVNATLKSDSLNLMSDVRSSGNKYRLIADIRATNSGYLQNKRVYVGAFMRDAAKTWVEPFNKPILRNHDISSDPIGRILEAQYTQLKTGLQFERDYQNPDRGTKLGSGFLTLKNEITDPDAIEKILDGRYQTVSTSHYTDTNICSICGIDWNRDTNYECTHRPGQEYQIGVGEDQKTVLCYLINGKMEYVEESFVNAPAQPNTKILSTELSSDSYNRDNYLTNEYDCLFNSLLLCDYAGNSENLLLNENTKDSISNRALNLITKKIFVFTNKDNKNMSVKSIDEKIDALKSEVKAEGKTEVKAEDKSETLTKSDTIIETNNGSKSEVKTSDALDIATLNSVIKDLTASKDKLADEAKVLKAEIDTKTTLITRLTDQVAKLNTDIVNEAAKQLALIRVSLKKAGTEGIKDANTFNKYVDSFTKRSLDSLRDSLNDHLSELEDMYKTTKSNGSFADSRAINPCLAKTDSTNTPVKETGKSENVASLRSKDDYKTELMN